MKTQSTILGYIGNQPKSVLFDSGKSLVRFSVAVNEYKAGEKTKTTWFDIQAWNELGAQIVAHVAKGRQVKVVGRPMLNTYICTGLRSSEPRIEIIRHFWCKLIETINGGWCTLIETERKLIETDAN